jgi:hypothetical protein
MKSTRDLQAVILACMLGCGGLVDHSGRPGTSNNAGSSGGGASSSGGASSGAGGSSNGSGGSGGSGGAAPGTAPPICDAGTNWQCAVDTSCGASTPTTLKGRVFDPAGINPLQNVVVYIPDDAAKLPAVTSGTSTCPAPTLGDYVAFTFTDASGAFTLTGVPTGTGVPVTVQVGKWRRTTTVDIASSCTTTTVPDVTLRLPRNRTEGDMPQMALLTGGCDDFGCFMRDIGIDAAEFTAPHAGGAVDVYQGLAAAGNGPSLSSGTAGNCTDASCPLWANKQSLESYDMAILSCECGEDMQTKPVAAMQAMHDWLNEGGKVLASHYQYTWFRSSPAADFQNVVTWLGPSVALASSTYDLNVNSPSGRDFGQWLEGLGAAFATSTAPPTIELQNVASSVSTVNSSVNQWICDPSTNPEDTKALSFNTPIGGMVVNPDTRTYCGGVVFTDLHTTGGSTDMVSAIPSGCAPAKLTPQQDAEEFLFFDLAAWDHETPPPTSPPGPE